MSKQGSNKSGFSLIELLIALTLALVVGAMTTLFLLHQHRFTHGVTEVVSTQDRLHDAVYFIFFFLLDETSVVL
jgi:prepilin-type N-terminal cleavage/methylation domain-containing protein